MIHHGDYLCAAVWECCGHQKCCEPAGIDKYHACKLQNAPAWAHKRVLEERRPERWEMDAMVEYGDDCSDDPP